MTKIFHNLKGKFHVKISVILNELEKYMAFTIYKNLDFADSMQFMIFSLGTSNFFSSLKDESITEKDYLHVIDVWNMLKEKTMGGYHDFYLKTDVLLLVDVYEKYINTCLEYYKWSFSLF